MNFTILLKNIWIRYSYKVTSKTTKIDINVSKTTYFYLRNILYHEIL